MRALFLLLSTGAAIAQGATLAITGATVVHPEDGRVEQNATVVLDGDRIASVGAGVKVPASTRTLDGRGKWLIPGLIDAHVHFFQSGDLFTRPDGADFRSAEPYEKELAWLKARLPLTFRIWLAQGVTGVADVGGPLWNFEVRERAAKIPAPRVVVAGPLLSTVTRPQLDLGDPPIVRITSPDEARALVRRELLRKPDFVKYWFVREKDDDLAAKEANVRAAAEESHAGGIRLLVHATELSTAKAALRAGADILVHSVFDAPVDAEFLALVRKRGAIYIPTLFVPTGYQLALSGRWRPTEAERVGADPEVLARLQLDRIPQSAWPERVKSLVSKQTPVEPERIGMANLKAVLAAGIPVAMGTDAGNTGTVHGPSIHREMALMVEAGLSPAQVLRCATVGGARVLGREKELGDVAPGKSADLVLLGGDPLASVENLQKVEWVIRAGKPYRPDALRAAAKP